MSTQKQLSANRANARKSTGPKTKKGKGVTKLNAIKHGLQAEHILLPGEKKRDFHELRDTLFEALTPQGPIEVSLMDRVAAAMWRLRRVYRIEVGILSAERLKVEARRICSAAKYIDGGLEDKNLDIYEPSWSRTSSGVERINPTLRGDMEWVRSQACEDLTVLGFAFIRDASGANALTKLSRYETGIERSMYRALHELEKLQERRKCQAGDTNNVIDVTVGDDGSLKKKETG